MNPESTAVAQVGATPDSAEAPALDAATPTTHDVAVTTAQEPTAASRPPGGTLRLTFKLRLEDAREVLLDIDDDSLDFRHGPYKQSVAIVGDQVRKVFEAIVAEPLFVAVNEYVRLKLDAGQASPGTVENQEVPTLPGFPSPQASAQDGNPI